ncbi:alpha/beta fold hydrolase [Herbiconiux ginsengi]|uniref:alpha/beta fold hydrolase n=1 Tax=Herbiconiux ginsengi TaxID=381665 RepID=UPI000B8276E7
MHGDSDTMAPLSNVDALARRFPQATVQVFPDSGHGVVFQNSEALTEIARNFLRR